MKTEYGSTDAAASSCVLLYDFFGNSYAGEPTVNLFTQPIGATIFSGVYASSVDDCGVAGTVVYLNGDKPVNFPAAPALVTGYLDFTQTGGGGTAPVDGYYVLNISGNKNYTICKRIFLQSRSSSLKTKTRNCDFVKFSTHSGNLMRDIILSSSI